MYYLPNELIDIIITYLYADCNHCLKLTYYQDLQQKLVINKYRSIFDDDYNMPHESVYFNIICNKCLKKYFIDDQKFIYSLKNENNSTINQKCFCKIHT